MKFSMILSNNNRSKAYLQNLIKHNLLPEAVIYLDKLGYKLAEQTENDSNLYSKTEQTLLKTCPVSGLSFDEKESIISTLEKYEIDYKHIESLDPNEDKVVSAVGKLATKNCIYSGPGGIILRSGLFETGKKFLHAHPGNLPMHKGSTTIYYSLLIDKTISVSVIELNENLDEGDILLIEKFKFKSGESLDYVIDPCVRARSLINYLKDPSNKEKQHNSGNTFYIIHPVLKHLSIIKNEAY